MFSMVILHFLRKGHGPIAVEGTSGIDADRQRYDRCIFVPAHAEEVGDGTFDGGLLFIVPVDTHDAPAPYACWGHPNVLNGTRSIDLCDGECFVRIDRDVGIDFPGLSQIPCGPRCVVFVAGRREGRNGHASFSLLSGEILGTDRSRLGI